MQEKRLVRAFPAHTMRLTSSRINNKRSGYVLLHKSCGGREGVCPWIGFSQKNAGLTFVVNLNIIT